MDDLWGSLTRARDALAKAAVDSLNDPAAGLRNTGAGADVAPRTVSTRDAAPERGVVHAANVPDWAIPAIGAAALVLVILGLVFSSHVALKLGVLLAVAGGGLFVAAQAQSARSKPGVSMGASVGRGAHVDPTAAIAIGAAVGPGAWVGPEAVVRVGANVGREAVVEAGAVISYGASIGRGAVVGEGAVVGAGSEVARDAQVPAGIVLRPGSSFKGGRRDAKRPLGESQQRVGTPERSADVPAPERPAQAPGAKAQPDPRAIRVAAACARLETGLRDSPQGVRNLLGGSGLATVDGLRRTCDDLRGREAALRREADLGQLAEERLAIERRIDRETDPQIGESLRGALSAIDGQVKERERLRLAADRIAAEHTRLLYTLEELAAQLARLRSAGDGARQAADDVPLGVTRLRVELEAIADALESVR